MHDLLASDAPDEAAVMEQAELIGRIQTASHKHRLATLLEIRALLTPEQRDELGRIREELGPPGHRGGPDGPCPCACAQGACGEGPADKAGPGGCRHRSHGDDGGSGPEGSGR